MDITVKDHQGDHQVEEFFIDEPCVVSFFVGELGWLVQRWQAYLRHLKQDVYPDHKFFMMLNGQFHVIVQDFVAWTIDLPKDFYQLGLETDCYEAPLPGTAAGALTPSPVWVNLIEYIRQFYNIEKAVELWTPRGVNTWIDMQPQLFTRYTTESLVESPRPIITVFPRGRARANNRNVPEFVWYDVVESLRQTFNIILCGTPSGACLVNYQAPGVENLIGKAGLDQVFHLLNNSVCSISSQSGPTHLSVLNMCPSYIIGHEQRRHTVDDNRFNTPTSFRYLSDYRAIDAQTVIQDISEFIQLLQQHDEFNAISRRTFKPAIRRIASQEKTNVVGAILNYQNISNVGNIVNLLDIEKLYLVGTPPQGEDAVELTNRLNEFGKSDKIHWVATTVEDGLAQIEEKLDFVYADTYVATETCLDYFYKLKPGGVFSSGDKDAWSELGFPFPYRRMYSGYEEDIHSRYQEGKDKDTGWYIIQGGPLRESFRNLKGRKNLVGAEIGVYLGENSKSILDNLDVKQLYLIDPYETGLVGITDEGATEYILGNAKRLLEEHSNKITWIRRSSEEAAAEIPNKLDFVYVDGDHTYEGAYKDFETYWPKIKKGGILGGHDFDNEHVARAATDYLGSRNGEYTIFSDVDQDGTVEFWVYKINDLQDHTIKAGYDDFKKLTNQRKKYNG